MTEIFQKIKQENTAKIFHENYIVKHNPIFGLLTLIHITGNSNIVPMNTQDTHCIVNQHPMSITPLC